MGIKVNLSGVEGGEFELIPQGNYNVRVTEGELKQSGPGSKNPGAEYIAWELTIQDEGKFQGRKLFTNTSLLPHALFGIKGLLSATGNFSDEQLGDELDFEIEDVIGSELVAVVDHREYEGEMRSNVKRLKRAGSAKADSNILP